MPFPPDHEDRSWHELPDEDRLSEYHRQATSLEKKPALRIWNPVPVKEPEIDPNLTTLSWPERSAAVVRYSVLGLEHWLSPGGLLRELIRWHLWLAVILTVSSVILVPAVTAVLLGAAEWTSLGTTIIGNVTTAVTSLPPIVMAIVSLFLLLKVLQHYRGQRQRSRDYPGNGY